ncbi:Carboxylic ester hydrolase [Mycena venus]|uniref:Carboxylic ester hydrolase n=1 Tax=Mycena venus TaxID=2733690 RepID=A0A8H7CNH1_9AGAR|nr:Carboxylic ester hydrolase [Mycena venus]
MISLLFLPLSILFRPDSAAATAGLTSATIVPLPYGTFRGFTTGNLTQFLGLPFGQAPRFESPREPAVMHGVQNATSFGPACPQQKITTPPGIGVVANTYPAVSEECLTLDIFRPTVTNAKLPVFVWIYGGGFEVGNSRDYDLTPVVERSIEIGEPILVVTANYRVNALGFLAGKEVAAAGISNLGLRDQKFALEWVQKHISAFGGDPNRVVLGGVSAGSISAAFLTLDNKQHSNTLFHGAFLQSGPAIPVHPLADGQTDYDGLVTATNCTASSDTLACLRRVPFDSLMAAVNNTANMFSYSSLNLAWAPRIDGDVIEYDPFVSISRGLYGKIPILAGMCDDEGTLFSFSTLNVTTDAEFLEYVHSNYLSLTSKDQMAQLSRLFPDDPTQGSPFDTGTANQLTPEFKRLAAFQGDLIIASPRRFLLEHASSTQNVWGWLNKVGKATNGPIGAAHASDTPIWFTTGETTVGIDALLNFINTLDPNCPTKYSTGNTSISWPKWNSPSSSGSSSLLTFSDTGINITADNFRSNAMDFLNNLRVEEAGSS